MAYESGNADGIDQAAGNSVSRIFDAYGRQTWENGGNLFPVVEYGQGFSSFRGIPLDGIGARGVILGLGADGVGTKVEVAERMGDHRTMGFDLIAMSCDDAVIRGAQPVAMVNIMDANTLKDVPADAADQLGHGMLEAANTAGLIVLGGESASLGRRVNGYGPFNYNWGSAVVWMVRQDRIIDNTGINPGDLIVGFEETGLRSNGLTEVRSAFSRDYGERWHDEKIEIANEVYALGDLALKPSVIYSQAMVDLTGGSDPHRQPKANILGAAHITGGGLPEKLGRALLNTGLGAEIVDPFDFPPVLNLAQFHSPEMSDETAYRTWHGGQGMVNIVREKDAEVVISIAAQHGVDAKVIGYVAKRPGIRILSQGLRSPGKMLSFEA